MFEKVPWVKLHGRLSRTMRQGEHALVCAPTGRGKTVLMQEINKFRSDLVFFGTKTYDEEYDRMLNRDGFTRIAKWPPRENIRRVMLWPRPGKVMSETRAIQKDVFEHALNKIFNSGRWSICFDELHWLADNLGLYKDIAHLHHQGRSSKLTFYDGFQRPAYVPVIVYSSATHVFVWGTNYKADLDKLASVAKFDAITRRELAAVMGSLDTHEFVYVNVRDQQPPVISKVAR